METSTASRYVREVKLRRDKVTSFDQYPFSLPVVRHPDRTAARRLLSHTQAV